VLDVLDVREIAAVALHVALPAGDAVHYAYPFAVAAVMVLLVLGRMPWSTLLAHRSMRFLGILAYGVYLVHLIVVTVLVAGLGHLGFRFGEAHEPRAGWLPSIALCALAALASFGIALMLNRTVEAPMIGVGRKVSARLGGGRGPRSERVAVGRGPAGEAAAP
jgi:peptidoglycan/LPS O-acetylase OafA/YrhL